MASANFLLKKSMADLKQIAQALGVSTMTVSRALRNRPGLSKTTKERVLQKAIELGYNKIPLLGGYPAVPHKLGILAYEEPSGTEKLFDTEIPHQIFVAIQEECRRHKVETVIEFPRFGEIPLSVKNRTVEGLFVFGRYSAGETSMFQDIPAMAVSSYTTNSPLPRVVADNQQGMRIATQHLIELGHRRIIFWGLDNDYTMLYRERGEGYILAMLGANLKVSMFYTKDPDPTPILDRLRDFSAVVCSTDWQAHHLQDAIRERGGRIPESCSIVGFDNTLNHGLKERILTTYAPDWNMLGTVAANLMLFRPKDVQKRDLKIVVSGNLIIRKSTQRAARQ